jgi:hypothetical protein
MFRLRNKMLALQPGVGISIIEMVVPRANAGVV